MNERVRAVTSTQIFDVAREHCSLCEDEASDDAVYFFDRAALLAFAIDLYALTADRVEVHGGQRASQGG